MSEGGASRTTAVQKRDKAYKVLLDARALEKASENPLLSTVCTQYKPTQVGIDFWERIFPVGVRVGPRFDLPTDRAALRIGVFSDVSAVASANHPFVPRR